MLNWKFVGFAPPLDHLKLSLIIKKYLKVTYIWYSQMLLFFKFLNQIFHTTWCWPLDVPTIVWHVRRARETKTQHYLVAMDIPFYYRCWWLARFHPQFVAVRIVVIYSLFIARQNSPHKTSFSLLSKKKHAKRSICLQ